MMTTTTTTTNNTDDTEKIIVVNTHLERSRLTNERTLNPHFAANQQRAALSLLKN
jgi:hypothetical protein